MSDIQSKTEFLCMFVHLQRVENLLFNCLHPLVPILGAPRLEMPLLVVQGDDLQLESLLLHIRPALGVALHPPVPLLHVGCVPAVLPLLLLLAPARLPQNFITGQGDLDNDVVNVELFQNQLLPPPWSQSPHCCAHHCYSPQHFPSEAPA